jgi:hypothetical protein
MSSSLVSAGMWALSTFKQYKSLKELNFEDEGNRGDIQKSLLYRLAMVPEGQVDLFASFHRIVLVSSPEDQYVPTYSANLEVPSSIMSDTSNKGGEMISHMALSLLSRINISTLVRMTVFNLHPANSTENSVESNASIGNYSSSNKKSIIDINQVIGRTAHICYLDNAQFTRQLILSLLPYLQERVGMKNAL